MSSREDDELDNTLTQGEIKEIVKETMNQNNNNKEIVEETMNQNNNNIKQLNNYSDKIIDES